MRTTVDILDPLHEEIRQLAHKSGTSMRMLILRALEQSYGKPAKSGFVTGPIIPDKGTRGPLYPGDENPYDLIFS